MSSKWSTNVHVWNVRFEASWWNVRFEASWLHLGPSNRSIEHRSDSVFGIELAHGSFTLFAMRLTPFALGFSLVLVSSIASAAVTNYKVHLTQAPTWQNDAGADVGDGTFTYDDGNQTLSGVVNHTVDNAFNAKLYYREGDAGFGGGDKTIKSFQDTESPIGVAVKLTAEQATALANSQVHFQLGSGFNEADGVLVPEGGGTPPADDAGTGATDPDSGSTDPGTTDPGTTDPGTTDPGTTDPGTTDPGNDSTNSDDSNADGSEEEEEESSGKKSGCSVIRAGANDPATIGGASLAGLFGIALLARRRRKS